MEKTKVIRKKEAKNGGSIDQTNMNLIIVNEDLGCSGTNHDLDNVL